MSGGIGGGESGVPETLLTTKGQIHGYSTTNSAVSISGNDGYLMTEDSTDSNGIAWKVNSGLSSPLTSDLVFNDSVNASFGTSVDASIRHDGSHWYFITTTGYSIWNGSFTMGTGECMSHNYANATISSGTITGSSNTMRLDTEGAGSTDDLDSADFGGLDVTGTYFSLLTQNNSRDVTVKDQSVSPFFLMPSDFTLDTTQDILYFSALNGHTHNHEISRSDNS